MSPLAALLLALLVAVGLAEAHPGRLDREGCHEVRTEFVYRSGKVAPAGERHCHRTLTQGMKLDGSEVLQDRADTDRPPTDPPAQPEPERRLP